MAVGSIARTLDGDGPKVGRVKIRIHGQEVGTLAGHLDLTQAFLVNANAGSGPQAAATPGPAAAAPALTPTAATGKLNAPATKTCAGRADAAQRGEGKCEVVGATRTRIGRRRR